MAVNKRRLAIVFALALIFAGALAFALGRQRSQPTGLFSTLPLLWAESATIADMLKTPARPHWAKAVLEARGGVVPVDSLAQLRGFDTLVMAQPRPLSPEENVALDGWVRGGGRVLLLADPMLTAPSAFALGDRRRPQDVVLISPILARWGLRLDLVDGQPFGQQAQTLFDMAVPVNLPGRFALLEGAPCTLAAEGLAAECRVGKGRVLAIADAALLEQGDSSDEGARAALFDALLDRLEAAP